MLLGARVRNRSQLHTHASAPRGLLILLLLRLLSTGTLALLSHSRMAQALRPGNAPPVSTEQPKA
jgi:hypothetical protein